LKEIIIDHVYLQNFKSHDEIDFDFSEKNKLIVFSGPNGSGKTSIIDAILWALTDNTTLGKRNVVKNKVGKNCLVKLNFKIKQDDILDEYIVYSYKNDTKYGDKKLLYKNDELLFIDNAKRKTVNDYLSNIIMPEKVLYKYIVFSSFFKQTFTELSNSDKKKLLEKMLDLEKYDDYHEQTKKSIEKINKNLEDINRDIERINTLLENINDDIKNVDEELKEKLDQKNNNITEYQNKLDELNKKIKDKDKLKSQLEELKKEKEKLNSDKAKTEEKLETEKTNYNEFFVENKKSVIENNKNTELNDLEKKYNKNKNELDNEINSKNNSIVNNEKNKSQEESKITNKYLEKIKPIEKELLQINNKKSELTRLEKEGKSKKSKKTDIDNKLKQQKEKIESSKNLLNEKTCFSCQTKLSDINNDEQKEVFIKELNISIENMEEEYNNINNDLQEIEKELEKIRNDYKEIKEYIQENEKKYNDEYNELINERDNKILEIENKYKEEKNKLNNELKDLNKKLDKLNEKYERDKNNIINKYDEELKEEKKKLKQEYEEKTQDIQNTLKSLTEKLTDVSAKIKNLENEIDNIIEIENEIKEYNSKIEYEKSFINELKESSKKRKDELNNQKKSNEKELKEENKKLDIYNEELKVMNFWKTAFGPKGIRAILLDEAIPMLNKKSRELCENLDNIKVYFDNQKETTKGEVKDDFIINAINYRELSELEDFSRGEKRLTDIIVLLCVRDLIEKLQGTKIDLLMLDEILDTLYQDNAESVVNMLMKLTEEQNCLLLTHTLNYYINPDEHYKFKK